MNAFDGLGNEAPKAMPTEDIWTTLVLVILAIFPGTFTEKDWNEWVEQGLRLIEKEKNTPGGSL